jgi:hypothetical protein
LSCGLNQATDAERQALRELVERAKEVLSGAGTPGKPFNPGAEYKALLNKFRTVSSGKDVLDVIKNDESLLLKVMNVVHEHKLSNVLGWTATPIVNLAWVGRASLDLFEQFLAYPIHQALTRGAPVQKAEDVFIARQIISQGTGHIRGALDYGRSVFGGLGQLKPGGGYLQNIGTILDQAELDPIKRQALEGLGNRKFITGPYIMQGIFGASDEFMNKPIGKAIGETINWLGMIKRLGLRGLQVTDGLVKNSAYMAGLSQSVISRAMVAQTLDPLTKTVRKLAPNEQEVYIAALEEDALRLNRKGIGTLQKMDAERAHLVLQVHEESLTYARNSAFQGTFSSKRIEEMVKGLNAQTPIAKFFKITLFLFTRTPLQILGYVGHRLPVTQQLSKRWWQDIKGLNGKRGQAMATAQFLESYMIVGSLFGLAHAGIIRGRHPKERRDLLLSTGIPEYSVRIGSRWVSFKRLDPLAMYAGIAADLYGAGQYLQDGELSEMTSALIVGMVENTIDKTYLQGLGDLFKALDDPKRYGEQFIKNQITSVFPQPPIPLGEQTPGQAVASSVAELVLPSALVAGTARITDPKLREVRDLMDSYLANTPWGRGTLPVKTDVFGRELERDHDFFGDLGEAIGARVQTTRNTPALLEAARLNAFSTDSEPTILGVNTLSKKEYEQWRGIMNELQTTEIMNRLVTSQGYARLSDFAKFRAFRKVQAKITNSAKRLMIQRSPSIRDAILEKQRFDIQRLMESGAPATQADFETINDILNHDPAKHRLFKREFESSFQER